MLHHFLPSAMFTTSPRGHVMSVTQILGINHQSKRKKIFAPKPRVRTIDSSVSWTMDLPENVLCLHLLSCRNVSPVPSYDRVHLLVSTNCGAH